MRRIKTIFQVGSATMLIASLLAIGLPAPARTAAANAPSLTISQLKITSSSGQFITLYNSTGLALDMSKYQLEYFNNYDLSKATSSKLISLSGIIPPHGYFMVNDGVYTLCYQLSVDSVSLGLSSTVGMVEVLAFDQANPGGSVAPVLQDYVGWSKTAAPGAQTLPPGTNAFLQRQPVDAANNPAITAPGAGSWQSVQPDPSDICDLVSGVNGGAPVATGLGQLLPSTEPPATILSLSADETTVATPTANLPAADIGLMAPEVTELLPNPNGTGNDAADEFIELYNPNAASFDLSGFALQAGTTTLHSYHFVNGAQLPPHGFTAFYSDLTALSLSNSGGQVKLLDPFGNSVFATALYSTAKDGQAWALANGKWYWTTKLTPGAANIINQPVSSKKSSTAAKTPKTTAKTKSAKTPKTKATANYNNDSAVSSTPIHYWALALVVALALLYGAYEYRADMANRIHRLKQHIRARREDRA
jgi:hypothetical protein